MNEDQKTLKVIYQGTNKLQNYEILSPLGRGSNSFVYKVKFLPSDKIMAMKVIDFKTKKQQKKALNEIEINESLSHPNIVKFIDKFFDETYCYLIFQFCNQGELYQYSKTFQNKNNCCKNQKIFKQLLEGLDYLHSKNIVHGDLKLGNIFLHDDQIKIGDFGLSQYDNNDKYFQAEKQQQTNKNQSIQDNTKFKFYGTPNYMAPESLKNQKITFKSDIWSMGCIFYAMIFGQTPFQGSNIQATIQKILQFDKENFNLQNTQYKNLLENMFEYDEHKRKDCQHLLKILSNQQLKKKNENKTKKQKFFNQLLMDKQLLKSRRQFHSQFKQIKNYQNVRRLSTKARNDQNYIFSQLTQSNSVKNKIKEKKHQKQITQLHFKKSRMLFQSKGQIKKNFLSFMDQYKVQKKNKTMQQQCKVQKIQKQEPQISSQQKIIIQSKKLQQKLKEINNQKNFYSTIVNTNKKIFQTKFGSIKIFDDFVQFQNEKKKIDIRKEMFDQQHTSNIQYDNQKYFKYVKEVLKVYLQNKYVIIEDNLLGKFRINLNYENCVLKSKFYKDETQLTYKMLHQKLFIQKRDNILFQDVLTENFLCENQTYLEMINYAFKTLENYFDELLQT